MNKRLTLIGVSVIAGIGGAWLALVAQSRMFGFALFLGGMTGLAIEKIWQRRDESLERDAQSKWLDRVMEISDDTSLSGYGIETLLDLACYHDAQGRADVLSALLSLPKGQRMLLTAARQVDPEAQWD